MTEQRLSRIDLDRLELFRSGIENETVTVQPEREKGKVIVKLTSETDEGPVEQIITNEDEVAYLISLKEQSKK